MRAPHKRRPEELPQARVGLQRLSATERKSYSKRYQCSDGVSRHLLRLELTRQTLDGINLKPMQLLQHVLIHVVNAVLHRLEPAQGWMPVDSDPIEMPLLWTEKRL